MRENLTVPFQTGPVVGGQNNRLHHTNNTPYPERSNGTKSPNWRGNDALGHVKIQIWWLCVTCLSHLLFQFGDFFVPRDRSAANGPLVHDERASVELCIHEGFS